MLQNKMPPKLKDPGSFIISYFIRTKYSGKVPYDLEASINLMPLSVFKQLDVGEIRPTIITLQLTDTSHAYLKARLRMSYQKWMSLFFSLIL